MAVLLAAAPLQAQQQYDFIRYSISEGLPQSQVFAAMQDSRGYMWFGTQGGGVCRFDGIRFETFTTDMGLPSNYVNAVYEDAAHHIWVGTNRGFGWFDGKKWQTEPSFTESVSTIGEIASGDILIGYSSWMAVANAKGVSEYPRRGITSRAPVYALHKTPRGIWVATNKGAYLLDQPGQNLTTANGLPSNLVRALARDARGNLWLATAGGIAVVDETHLKVLTVFQNPLLQNALCLRPDGDGNMWAGTSDSGISIWSPADSSWTHITEQQGLPHNHVRALVRDNSGNMWAATSGGGVVRFVTQDFRHYDRSDGLAGDRIYAVLEDHSGRIWMSVSQNGLQVMDATGLHRFEGDSGYLNIKCRTLAEDKFGRIWAGTEGRGIAIFDSTGMRTLTKADGLPGDFIQKIVSDPRGDMWVATTYEGIARISLNDSNAFSYKIIGKKEGLADRRITTMALDTFGSGAIYFATQSGKVGWISTVKLASKPDNHVGHVWGSNAGLPAVPIRCLAFNGKDKIWVGTKGEGIYRLMSDAGSNDYTFQPLQSPRPLSSKNIYLLQFDPFGNLWVGSENGVDKISFEKNGFDVAHVEHFGKNEGFAGIETCQDAAIGDRAGNLWFGTMNGLTKYTPSNRKFRGSVPVLHFENISLFYKPLRETTYSKWAGADGGLLEGLALAWNENHLSFEFRGIDLNRPDAVRYRWKLDGASNADWSPLSTRSSVNLAGLAPGQYTFWAQATSDGTAFSAPLKASFSVKKPFWQVLWFQLVVGCFLFAVVYLFFKNRIRRIRQAEAAKREQLEVQNRFLQLEQKALQLQMNPHFIFNALNSIQSLVSTGDAAAARQELNAFARLMRSILSNSRRQVISLKEEAETLEQYLRIEQFCQQNKFEFSIRLPENTDPDEIELPPMLLQPFVENAVIHGVSHLQYEGKIEVSFRINSFPSGPGLLECTIRDNGVGREKAAMIRRERKPGHSSLALEVTRERLEALKNGLEYEALEYSDLADHRGNTSGTQVVIRLPLQMNY
ncbi:MAG: histidine kinase [Lewinellaceae bacterium]|nr:histidine kinase [Lewinellaceae bacterium]